MVSKAQITVLDTNETIEVMFNPKEYTVSTVGDITGEGASLSFNKVNISDFTVTLLFDTYEKQTDVREKIEKITSLVMPKVEGKETKKPHVCLFSWGKFTYKGIIYKHDQKFTMFLPSGIPVRADLTVTFKSVVTTEEDVKLKGAEACRKLWTVKSGDRLDLIADKALKDVSLWRKIADENNILNPLEFPKDNDIGRTLIIPD